jgi:hypothetical protein
MAYLSFRYTEFQGERKKKIGFKRSGKSGIAPCGRALWNTMVFFTALSSKPEKK